MVVCSEARTFLHTLDRMKYIALIFVLLSVGCTSLFYYPDNRRYSSPRDYRITYHEFQLSEVGRPTLVGWILEPQAEMRGSLLFLHGNAGNISTHLGVVAWLAEAGYRVYLIDYAGYGGSEGIAEIEGMHEDVRRMMRYFLSQELKRERRILFGQSLGASLALRVTSEDEFVDSFSFIVADSGFSSYRKIAREKIGRYWLTVPLMWPLGFLVRDEFSPIYALSGKRGPPILILHGAEDETVPASHGDELCRKLEERCILKEIPSLDHIQYLQTRDGRAQLLRCLELMNEEC